MAERELTTPVDLAIEERLNPAAVGWSRRPLHRTQIAGWGRTKRWEYWGVVTDRFIVGLVVAGIDYLATASIYVLDRTTGEETKRDAIAPFGRPRLSDEPGDGTARLRAGIGPTAVSIAIDDTPGRTTITARAKGVDLTLDVTRPDHDSLSVVVPWRERRFQYTVKDLANPVAGTLTLDGTTHDLGTGWAVLDRGRGRWPYAMTWNWGAGCGVVDGSTRAIQVGGKWTDGTGSTENAVFVDGVQHYIDEELSWQYDLDDPASPWRVVGEHADVTLTPCHRRVERTNAVVVASTIYQALGTWSGWMLDASGTRVSVDGLTGWAEQAQNRW